MALPGLQAAVQRQDRDRVRGLPDSPEILVLGLLAGLLVEERCLGLADQAGDRPDLQVGLVPHASDSLRDG